jgi:hypothetical protein
MHDNSDQIPENREAHPKSYEDVTHAKKKRSRNEKYKPDAQRARKKSRARRSARIIRAPPPPTRGAA